MSKKVLLIGHCGPDASYLRLAVRGALPDAAITAINHDEMLDKQLAGIDLALVNRVLDGLFAETNGIELIRRLAKEHPKSKYVLISNYADAQAAAVAAGALRGFGKRDLGSSMASNILRKSME